MMNEAFIFFVGFTLGMVWGFGFLIVHLKWREHCLQVKQLESEEKMMESLKAVSGKGFTWPKDPEAKPRTPH